MNTMSKTLHAKSFSAEKASVQKAASTFWQKTEDARYGIIPILLTLVACMGGITAAFGTGNSVYQLSLVVFPTMLCLTFILAVAPMRLVIWAGIIALVMDLGVMLF